jgi:hypothetical protein
MRDDLSVKDALMDESFQEPVEDDRALLAIAISLR